MNDFVTKPGDFPERRAVLKKGMFPVPLLSLRHRKARMRKTGTRSGQTGKREDRRPAPVPDKKEDLLRVGGG